MGQMSQALKNRPMMETGMKDREGGHVEKEATDIERMLKRRKTEETLVCISLQKTQLLLIYCKISCQTLLQSNILLGEKLVL